MAASLLERYAPAIQGVLGCFDRVIVTGTLPDICHAGAATSYLYLNDIRIFDFEEYFAKPIREEIREQAERLAAESGLEVEYIRKKSFRMEERVRGILEERGEAPGLVHVFSVLEPHSGYRPWYDRAEQTAYLLPRTTKCLVYYFYLVHPELGLCHLRVPTWAPYRLQFYFNGHHHLARRLTREGIGHVAIENAFYRIEDFERAQAIADELTGKALHRILDRVARRYCPFLRLFPKGVHWSISQAEYATDILFGDPKLLAGLYDQISRAAIHAVKADDVATFLGKAVDPKFKGEIAGDFHLRIQGRRIRHAMGPVAIKMYDKRGIVLRIETTTNDITFFRHYREVEHRDGTSTMKFAPMKKTIHSLGALREVMAASNRRYLDYVSQLEDHTAGTKPLQKITEPVRDQGRPYPGFNFFDADHLILFRTIASGQFNISGFRNADLKRSLPDYSGSRISRLLKSLRLHGLIKKVARMYKYYLTSLGKAAILAALKIREFVIIPSLAGRSSPV